MRGLAQRGLPGLVAGAVGLASCGVYAAAPCEVDPSLGLAPAVDRTAVAARREFLEAALDRGVDQARLWSSLWGVTFGVAAIGQAVAGSLVDDRGLSIDLYVGATAAGVGTLVRALFRPAVLRERRQLRRQPVGPRDSCADVQRAERALAASARWEKRGRSLLLHGVGLAFSAATGLVLGLGFHRPLSANRQVMLGGVAGQLMLVTMPTPAMGALRRYRDGERAGRWSVSGQPLIFAGGFGAGIAGRF